MAEKALQRCVLAWLRGRSNSFTFKVPGTVAGIPNVFHVERGRLWAFKLKAPRGRVTPRQRYVLRCLAQAGAVAMVVRSLEEVQRAVLGGYGDRE